MKKNFDYEEIKRILQTAEGLGLVCASKYYHKGNVNCARLSELLKIPINRLKEMCEKLEALGFLKMHKIGNDIEIELLVADDEKLKHLLDEIIWDNKVEYGNIYKKFITMEFMNFLNGK
jgi:hypothetical protein